MLAKFGKWANRALIVDEVSEMNRSDQNLVTSGISTALRYSCDQVGLAESRRVSEEAHLSSSPAPQCSTERMHDLNACVPESRHT